MKLRKFALRGLIALAVTVALCMFFSRTVQSITTPKVQLITAESGRFEERLTLAAQVYFARTETIVPEIPQGVRAAAALVQPGAHVQAGDVIFPLHLPGYEEQRTQLHQDCQALSRHLMELDIANHGLPTETPLVALYDAMAAANDALQEALYAARLAAMQSGAPPETEAVAAARRTYEEAVSAYHAYAAANPGSEAILAYAHARDALLTKLEALTAQLLSLDMAAQATAVTAPRAGYVVAVDAVSVSFTLTAEGCEPVLRCLAPGHSIDEGVRADVLTDLLGTQRATVLGMEGSFLHIALPETLAAALPALMETGAQISIVNRARQSTTLLPASALHTNGEDAFVYQIEYVYGGLLSTRSMRVIRVPVTVIQRSSSVVSIAEDLAGKQLALREDRPLTDGQTVMEYIH